MQLWVWPTLVFHHFGLMQRCQCPNNNLYLLKLCLIKYEFDIHVFVSLNCLFQFWFLYKSDLRIYISWFIIRKRRYLPHFFSDEGFKSIILNRALPWFVWRVVWNYIYSPFNSHLYHIVSSVDDINLSSKTSI